MKKEQGKILGLVYITDRGQWGVIVDIHLANGWVWYEVHYDVFSMSRPARDFNIVITEDQLRSLGLELKHINNKE